MYGGVYYAQTYFAGIPLFAPPIPPEPPAPPTDSIYPGAADGSIYPTAAGTIAAAVAEESALLNASDYTTIAQGSIENNASIIAQFAAEGVLTAESLNGPIYNQDGSDGLIFASGAAEQDLPESNEGFIYLGS